MLFLNLPACGHHRLYAPGLWRKFRQGGLYLPSILLLLALQPMSALALPQAANPDAPVSQAVYRPVIRDYVPFRPVEPRPWKDVNDQVAPKPRVKTGSDR